MTLHMTVQMLFVTLGFALIAGFVEGEIFSWGSSEYGAYRRINWRSAMIGSTLGWLFAILLPVDGPNAPLVAVFTSLYGGILYLALHLTISKGFLKPASK